MKKAVFVPTFERSSFLYVCLEAIRKERPDIDIYVSPDRGTDESEVCDAFNAKQIKTKKHKYHGNSKNMLDGLKKLYDLGYDRVFIVEDDCIVNGTFFDWADNALDNPKPWMGKPFAASGWIFSPSLAQEEGPDLLLDWYLSVCSAIDRESLALIVQHANPAYYKNMRSYCTKTFPNDPHKGTKHYEQDGLVLKVAMSVGERITWPRTARSTHIGWHGYHMVSGKRPEGTLMRQVMVVKMALENPDVMQSLMAGNQAPETIECTGCGRLLVSTDTSATVICVPCFHVQHPEAPVCAHGYYYVKAKTAGG